MRTSLQLRILTTFFITLVIGILSVVQAIDVLAKLGIPSARINLVLVSIPFILIWPVLDWILLAIGKYSERTKLETRILNFLREHPSVKIWITLICLLLLVVYLLWILFYSWLFQLRFLCGITFVITFIFYGFVYLVLMDREESEQLIKTESFLQKFVKKSMCNERVETQLWDFKETLEMWHVKDERVQEEKSFKFCELVAGWANTSGGVMIVGITNSPREVVGIKDLENRLVQTRKIINRFIEPRTDFIHFQQVIIPNEIDEKKDCLIIVIAQTKVVIAVKDEKGRYSYPKRLETGLDRGDYMSIYEEKKSVLRDNYGFVQDIKRFVDG